MDSDSFEPIPIMGGLLSPTGPWELSTVSPETVEGVVPMLECARRSTRSTGKRPRASAGSARKKLAPSGPGKDDDDDDDDEKEEEKTGSSSPKGSDDEPEEGGEEGVIVQAETRSADLPGATNRGDPIFWFLSYRRSDGKGTDQSYIAGPVRFSTRQRARVWTDLFRVDTGGRFALSEFVNRFSDFARGRAGTYLVPQNPDGSSVPGSLCPLPQFRPELYQTVRCRQARASRFTGVNPPKSLLEVTFTGRDGKVTRTAYVLYTVWFEEPRPAASVVNAWNRQYPSALLETVDELLMQVRLPTATTALGEERLLEMAAGVNYAAPAQLPPEGLDPPLPEL